MLPQKPRNLKPMPKGHTFLGMGKTFDTKGPFGGYAFTKENPFWEKGGAWFGSANENYYCAPTNSEIVKLNGGPYKRPKPKPKVEPEIKPENNPKIAPPNTKLIEAGQTIEKGYWWFDYKNKWIQEIDEEDDFIGRQYDSGWAEMANPIVKEDNIGIRETLSQIKALILKLEGQL